LDCNAYNGAVVVGAQGIGREARARRTPLTESGSSVTVRAERAGRLLTITLDRPGQANALDMSTACQLRDAVGLTWTLPRLVGRARAADLMLTNRAVGAAEAAGIGLVARVVADDSLVADARAIAVELASGPGVAFGRIKRLLDSSDRATLADQLDAEAASIAACADHPPGRAGVAAFTAGRKPAFH
jgi:enoyl-CoA hydratase/carnithine racemase